MERLEWLIAAACAVLCGLATISSIWCLGRRGQKAERVTQVLLVLAAALAAGWLAAHAVRAGRFPAFGLSEALFLYGLAVLVSHLYTTFRHRVRGLSLILAPYVTLLVLAALVAIGQPVAMPAQAGRSWVAAHVCAAFLAYAMCTTSAMLGAVYLLQDNNLKRKRFGPSFELLPALEALDHLMSRQIGAAFLMLTVAAALGVHLVRVRGGGGEWATDPKIVATGTTWLIYAVLMHMRTSRAFHGRRLALVTLAGILLVLFSFLGVHLVASSEHDFIFSVAGAP